ncbi:MAG: alginate export family protein [Planctomycetota bacterium]
MSRRAWGISKMLRLMPLLLVSGACVTSESQEDDKRPLFERLSTGILVEAKGVEKRGVPVVQEIEELEKSSSTSPTKMEMIGAAGSALERDTLHMLGQRIQVIEKTEFEDLDRDPVPPFPVRAGDWLKVKIRIKKGDVLHARTIRKYEAQDRFKVEGLIRSISPERSEIRIGPVPLPVEQGAKLHLLREGVNPDDPLALFQEDEQKSVPFSIRLAERLHLGGELAFKFESNDEYDLQRATTDDRITLRNDVKADLLWRIDDSGSFGLLEATFGRRDRLRFGSPNSKSGKKTISRAYVYFRPSDALRFQVGRQDFDEEREWLYDEVLDGIRMLASRGPFDLEASASVGRELFEDRNETEDASYFIGLARYHVDDHHRLTAYVLQRKDSSLNNLEPYLFGLRSYSRPWRGFGHWIELAHSGGYHGLQSISGQAVDAGVMYAIKHPLRPTIALGYAFATGKKGGGEGFRQSGIQDNNSKFGGVTSFRYYGEVLDPELTNLEVITLGLGFRPLHQWSLDLLYHGYRQDKALNSLVNTDLRTIPNGRSRDLGWGADLILGHRTRNRLSLELVLGRFVPGKAFDDVNPAHKVQLQARIKF